MTVRPTWRGTAAAALGALLAVAGFLWRYPGVAGLGLALLVLAAGAAVAVTLAKPITATRTVLPRTVPRLGACTGTLELLCANRKLPAVVDASESVAGAPLAVDVPVLRPGERTKVTYRIPTERRGVLAVGPLTVRRRGPAGLAEGRSAVGGVIEVRVVPRVLPVRGLPSGVRRGQVGADERVERGGTDLVGLREYVPGDDLRRLHWATSARTGVLMIREDADPARPHLAVLLDDRAPGYPDAAAFEDAVEVAASLASAAVDGGHPVRVRSVTGSVDVEVPAGVDAAEALAALAGIGLVADASGGPVPARDLDVAAVVCGPAADLSELVLEAGRASVGVVMVLDDGPPVSASGGVVVLRSPDAAGLLARWDVVVAR